MAKSKVSGLGRGLDSIFADNAAEESGGVTILRLSDIEPRADQPRKTFDTESLAQLAESIATHGLIQPIVVRPSSGGFYQIIAGERRWRASRMAGLSEVPVIITDYDDKKAAETALVENIQRENLNPVEEAKAIKTLIEVYDLTQEAAAKQIGRSRSALTNSLRLLELPEAVLDMLASGTLSAGHARALLALAEDDDIIEAAELAVKKELSVRAVEELVKRMLKEEPSGEAGHQPDVVKVDYIAEIEKRAALRIGKKVKITRKGKNRRVEIAFSDEDEMEEILKKLCGDDIFED
ncbi:MAG: ParB/RepB/Spo0J family partition protein [Clostridia bacterium]|nr:ParB/RepB/Spo0J family partition protein [Clostridia bacterium]